MRKSRSHEQSPAFQFYASDWLTNPDRLRLSLEEQGAYILLYCHCWQGFEIEYDVEVLSRMCNCRIDKLKTMIPNIIHLFKQVEKNGRIYLQCIQAEEERKEQELNRIKRSKAGKLGARIRWKNIK
tara:strand:+ start:608 stop:985 length:378 start_codon:yes stop_codon:yes gene_type:complete